LQRGSRFLKLARDIKQNFSIALHEQRVLGLSRPDGRGRQLLRNQISQGLYIARNVSCQDQFFLHHRRRRRHAQFGIRRVVVVIRRQGGRLLLCQLYREREREIV
jgi:hypothetical protein